MTTMLACDGFSSVLFSFQSNHSLDSNDARGRRNVEAILDIGSRPQLGLIRNPSATFATTKAAPHWYESPKQSILVLQRYPDLILDMIASR